MSQTDVSLKKQVYDGVMNLIASGEFLPGSIISEKKIIEKFKVSKSPVREAMLELCKDGVLTSIPRCGYQVTEMSGKTLSEIVDLRLMLEITNFRNICKNITADTIEKTFSEVSEKQKINRKSVIDAEINNTDFHMRLASLSGNKTLMDIMKHLLEMYSRAYRQMYLSLPEWQSPTKTRVHDLFLDAWKKQEFQKAEDYLRQDIVSSLETHPVASF